MQLVLACRALACAALIAASHPALADRSRTECPPDQAIPEFVTRRIDLLTALPTGRPADATSVALEQVETCPPALDDPLARAGDRIERDVFAVVHDATAARASLAVRFPLREQPEERALPGV